MTSLVSDRDPLTVYVIVNGPLDMSPGKLAAQSFQACQRLMDRAVSDPSLRAALDAWRSEGTCTVVRVAQTEHIFARAQTELEHVAMVDEGLTEIEPGSTSCLAVGPVRRSEAPRLINHKRLQLLRG